MKNFYLSRFNKNKKRSIIHNPVSLMKVGDINTLIDEAEAEKINWEDRSRLLQIRRWRKIRGQLV